MKNFALNDIDYYSKKYAFQCEFKVRKVKTLRILINDNKNVENFFRGFIKFNPLQRRKIKLHKFTT